MTTTYHTCTCYEESVSDFACLDEEWIKELFLDDFENVIDVAAKLLWTGSKVWWKDERWNVGNQIFRHRCIYFNLRGGLTFMNLIICSYSDKLGSLMLFQIGSSIVFMETYEIKIWNRSNFSLKMSQNEPTSAYFAILLPLYLPRNPEKTPR